MIISLQMEIKSRKKYYNYLKENSFFYKELNRNPKYFNKFNDYIKNKYHLKITDKLQSTKDNIELITSMLDILK